MCDHKNIVVYHHLFHVDGEVGNRNACRVRCADCDDILFDGKGKEKEKWIQSAYDYIDKNKEHYDSMVDLTCDKLNEMYCIWPG